MNECSARQAEHMRQWKYREEVQRDSREDIQAEISKDMNEEKGPFYYAILFRIPAAK